MARSSKLHPTLLRRIEERGPDAPIKAWVLFTDKGFGSPALRRAAIEQLPGKYNARAIQRRVKRRTREGLFDIHDLPVKKRYLEAVEAAGVELRRASKWVNGVSVVGTEGQFRRIAQLSFVTALQPVRRGHKVLPVNVAPVSRDEFESVMTLKSVGGRVAADPQTQYGLSFDQLEQINLIALHEQGYTGSGVVVGVLDTGFDRAHQAFNDPAHPINVIAEYDFVDDDPDTSFELGDPSGQHAHGTSILGVLGAYSPTEYLGAAYDASFILCKTEDITAEYPAEEDNYVAGLEFIEANGGDVATSSLGYIDWYTQADLDGLTAVTTVAVNIATGNGVHCLSAAGNMGNDLDTGTSHLIAPADALQNIACGAVDSAGGIASFSSDGPSADGRVKPELLARGVGTRTVDPGNPDTYTSVNGTSLSTPLVAGAVACLVQAHPDWSVDTMRSSLFQTASIYAVWGQPDVWFVRGYGVVNALAASSVVDCNGNGVYDETDIAEGSSPDLDGNGVPDECQTGACCLCPPLSGCVETDLRDCTNQGGHFVENEPCTPVECPVASAPNDDCVDRALVTVGGYAIDTRCATADGPETTSGDCLTDPAAVLQGDVWFEYVSECDGVMAAALLDADFDARITVYCDGTGEAACPVDESTQYACSVRSEGPPQTDSLEAQVSWGDSYLIRVAGVDGAVGTGTLRIECTRFMCFLPSVPQVPAEFPFSKSRFLSFEAGDAGMQEGIRVTLQSLPSPHDVHNGKALWVGPPVEVSETSGVVDPDEHASGDTFYAARLQCAPHFMDWTTVGPIHVYGPEIIPGAVYDVQTVSAWCAPTRCSDFGEVVFTDPLTIRTSGWGDTVKDCQTVPCGAPNGTVDIIDVLAILNKFINLPTAPKKVRVDLEPAVPDFVISIADAIHALFAFVHEPYSFEVSVPECP